jgi:hypothetical protein
LGVEITGEVFEAGVYSDSCHGVFGSEFYGDLDGSSDI